MNRVKNREHCFEEGEQQEKVSAELLVRERWSMDNLSVIKKQSCLQAKCFGSGVYRGGGAE